METEIVATAASSRRSWKQSRAEEEQEPAWAREATEVRQDYVMGCVPEPVWDHSRTQLLDAPGEIHILHHHLARPGHQHATQDFQ
jgi:hypothetical protein